MLDAREKNLRLHNPQRPEVLFFDSFFVEKLLNEKEEDPTKKNQYQYENVSKWFVKEKIQKHIDVFAVERIFIPVNTDNMHWTLLVLHMQRKEMCYYDSMTGSQERGNYLKDMLKRWMVDEAQSNKGKSDFVEADKWCIKFEQCPQQSNGKDCGVFTMMFADFLVDNLALDFKQCDIVHFREKIAADILRGNLTY
jgi:sentrin-specific protease 1